MKRFPIFYAPDGDTVAAGGLAVPVIPPPTAHPVTEVNLAPTKVDVAKEIGVDTGVRSPAEIFGEDEHAKVNEEIDKAFGKRERGPDGKFLPKNGDKPSEAKPAAKAPEKPAAKATTPEPAAPAKIKIGDQEKTADEWAAYHKDLADKAATIDKPAETAKPDASAKIEPKPEEIAAQKKVRDDWEKTTREAYSKFKPTQEEVDKALASGNPDQLSELWMRPMIAMEERMRIWVQNSVNPILAELDGQLSPIASSQQQLAQYQAENQFLDANPEIKSVISADPAKMSVHRQVNEDLRLEMDDMKTLLASNPENARAKARLDALSKDFLGEMARETKARYASGGVTTPTTEAGKAVPKKQATPAERPLSGDRPGTSTAIKTETKEQRLAREMHEEFTR